MSKNSHAIIQKIHVNSTILKYSMSSYSVEVKSSQISKETPIGEDYVLGLVKEKVRSIGILNEIIQGILKELQKKSSKHKFLAEATNIKLKKGKDFSLNIANNFGAVWDESRDGYISLQLVREVVDHDDKNPDGIQQANTEIDDDENTTLLTLFWVYVG